MAHDQSFGNVRAGVFLDHNNRMFVNEDVCFIQIEKNMKKDRSKVVLNEYLYNDFSFAVY